jgi:hypothetical protein
LPNYFHFPESFKKKLYQNHQHLPERRQVNRPVLYSVERRKEVMFMQKAIRFSSTIAALLLMSASGSSETVIKPIPTQYIAALGDPTAKSGIGAETWGLWPVDPGPRGVRLTGYASLKDSGGIAPRGWKFNNADWWLEEHGLIMEQPTFPIVPGKYVVTGYRDATATLTVHPKAADGTVRWELNHGASLYDVTHLGCRAARYTPATPNSCSPEHADQVNFPVFPGAVMPPVGGCNKQDYQVLIVVGMEVEG